jgi:hypothetical protein
VVVPEHVTPIQIPEVLAPAEVVEQNISVEESSDSEPETPVEVRPEEVGGAEAASDSGEERKKSLEEEIERRIAVEQMKLKEREEEEALLAAAAAADAALSMDPTPPLGLTPGPAIAVPTEAGTNGAAGLKAVDHVRAHVQGLASEVCDLIRFRDLPFSEKSSDGFETLGLGNRVPKNLELLIYYFLGKFLNFLNRREPR